MKNTGICWKNDSVGNGVFDIIKSGKYVYELWAYRMDDEHLRMYPSNASGYKYHWSVATTEAFYDESDSTVLVDGYAMTLDEAKEKMKEAFKNRDRYRKEWREGART